MNCNPIISSDDFTKIHNALCDLDSVCQLLEAVVRPEVYQKLEKVRLDIRKGLQDAYEQDEKSFDRKNKHYSSVQEDLGLSAIWSVYDVDNLNDRHPYFGATKIVYKDHWGGKSVVKPVVGATWAALYVAADAAIRDSGDNHHVFIETFVPSKEDSSVLVLSTGS